jgi:hypothetical protein
VATDLRVLDVIVEPSGARALVLHTDVIVGGRSEDRPPFEETLYFARRDGAWILGRERP